MTCGTSSPWTTGSPDETTSSYFSVGNVFDTVSPPPAGTTTPASTGYAYDPNGNKISMIDPNGVETDYTYNPLNALVSNTTSGQTSTSYYDANGNVLAVTAPGGNPYSLSNTTGCDPLTTSTCSYTTYNTYNNSNKLLTSTNPDGEVTTNYYDASGNKVATTGPSGNTSTCNPTTSSTPCADTTTFTYNSLNQLSCEGQPNSANDTCASPGTGEGLIAFTYTANGQRASMTDSTGTTSYSYNDAGQVISITNGAGATVTYGYGVNPDPTCISYPNSANNTCASPGSGAGIVNYAYNQANQLATMTDWAGNTFDYTDDANGVVNDVSVNDGAVDVATSYDSAGNIASIDATASGGATTLLDLSYTRNPNGDIATASPQVGSTAITTDSYSYDDQNRVSSGTITGSTGSDAYGYTLGGGVKQDTTSFASAGYDQAGELCWTSASSSTNTCGSPPSGSTTFSTNTDGERTLTQPASGNPQSYSWDSSLGTLSCANVNGTTCSTSSPTSTSSVYGYNGDGLRTSSTLSSGSTAYTWDTSGSTPRLFADGTRDYLYLPGSNVPVEQISSSTSSPTADLLLTDANSSVRGLVQLSSGTNQNELVNYTDYDAYGNPITESGGTTEPGGLTTPQTSINSNYVGSTPFGFGGGYTDPTGLIYLVHRYYDPATGQFVSADPLVQETQEPYSYAGDDPVNGHDSTGNATTEDDFGDIRAPYNQLINITFSIPYDNGSQYYFQTCKFSIELVNAYQANGTKYGRAGLKLNVGYCNTGTTDEATVRARNLNNQVGPLFYVHVFHVLVWATVGGDIDQSAVGVCQEQPVGQSANYECAHLEPDLYKGSKNYTLLGHLHDVI